MIDSDNWTPWTASGDLTHVPPIGAASRDFLKADIDENLYVSFRERPANDNYPRLVALTGAAGSGKSTATKFLIERHGYTLVKFAGPLKDMLRAIGLDEDDIEGRYKETPHPLLRGKTPRHAMQTLGTEWGRNCIGEDFWAGIWAIRVQRVFNSGGRVVVDDCRFANEAGAIRKLGGMIIKLEGRGGIAGQHASEAGCGQHDAIVTNDSCVTELYAAVEQEVKRWAA